MDKSEFVTVTPQLKKTALDYYNKSEDDLKYSVNYIKKWIQTQKHLPQEQDEERLQSMIFSNEFDLEKTKQLIDNHYSGKHFVPEMFTDRDTCSIKMEKIMKCVMLCPLPKLTDDLKRVTILRLLPDKENDFDVETYLKFFFCVHDLIFTSDVSRADVYVVDFEQITPKFIESFPISRIYKVFTAMLYLYGDRIDGIHFINLPVVAYPLAELINAVLPEKSTKRMNIHKNFESLYKFVPRNVMPSDYHGNYEHTSQQLYDKLKKHLKKNCIYLKKLGNKKTNENLRTSGQNSLRNMFNLKQYEPVEELIIG